jgi:hypothetical protein
MRLKKKKEKNQSKGSRATTRSRASNATMRKKRRTLYRLFPYSPLFGRRANG